MLLSTGTLVTKYDAALAELSKVVGFGERFASLEERVRRIELSIDPPPSEAELEGRLMDVFLLLDQEKSQMPVLGRAHAEIREALRLGFNVHAEVPSHFDPSLVEVVDAVRTPLAGKHYQIAELLSPALVLRDKESHSVRAVRRPARGRIFVHCADNGEATT